MTGFIELGDNIEVNENSDGDFEILENGTEVITVDTSADTITLHKNTTLTDAAGVTHTSELADLADIVDDHGNLNGLGDDDHTQYILVDGSRAFTGDVDLGSNALQNATAIENQDYNESVNSIADASGSTDIDLSLANMHEVEADGDITITFSNVTTTPEGNSLLLRVYDDDGTGPHTITYPASVEWSQGTVYDTVDSNGELEISLRTYDGGTTWKASRSGENFS